MLKEELLFETLARSAPKSGLAGVWTAPQILLDVGGNLAVWAERGISKQLLSDKRQLPWMVLHGGPGGSLGAAHVAPLRFAGLPWFGFDQRNSGLSEDIDLSGIDLQLFIDDALQIADRLGIESFHVLGGSWGATLALALAAYRPERIASVVIRAPFIPLRPRVDAFFESLERIAPDYFTDSFGQGARTDTVCECFAVATPEHLLELSIAWNKLEQALLTGSNRDFDTNKPFLTDVQELALVRKYRLQAHFLQYDCFMSPADWNSLISTIAAASFPVSVVQGLNDRICPPGGARMISEMILRSRLIELSETGHLADSNTMMTAITEEVSHHQNLV